MAIIDSASDMFGLTKYLTTPIPSIGGGVYNAPSAHPFLMGSFPYPMYRNAYNNIAPMVVWNFFAADDMPGIGDEFGFRFGKNFVEASGTGAGNTIPGQWLMVFMDDNGNRLGGIRQIPGTAVNHQSGAWTIPVELVSAGDNPETFNLYPNIYCGALYSEMYLSCTVTADDKIVVAFYIGTVAEALTGTVPTLMATVTSDLPAGWAPVRRFGYTPLATLNDLSLPRWQADGSAMTGCAFVSKENGASIFVGNKLQFTDVGATHSAWPMFGFAANVIATSLNLSTAENQRRSLKMTPASGTVPTTGYHIVSFELALSYSIDYESSNFIGKDVELETFTTYAGVNYSLGRFGDNGGTQKYTIATNPATGIAFANYTEIEIGIVMREQL